MSSSARCPSKKYDVHKRKYYADEVLGGISEAEWLGIPPALPAAPPAPPAPPSVAAAEGNDARNGFMLKRFRTANRIQRRSSLGAHGDSPPCSAPVVRREHGRRCENESYW